MNSKWSPMISPTWNWSRPTRRWFDMKMKRTSFNAVPGSHGYAGWIHSTNGLSIITVAFILNIMLENWRWLSTGLRLMTREFGHARQSMEIAELNSIWWCIVSIESHFRGKIYWFCIRFLHRANIVRWHTSSAKRKRKWNRGHFVSSWWRPNANNILAL